MYTTVGYFILAVVASVAAVFLSFIIFYKIQFRFWKKRRIPYEKPTIPFGNFGDSSITKGPGQIVQDIYNKTKHQPYHGLFFMFKPHLLINDPELIKKIFVSDFIHFHDRGIYIDEENDPLAAGLFNLSGAPWRNLRVKLTPAFTSGKMKMMFQSIIQTIENLQRYLEQPAGRGEIFEIKDLMARFTTDVIASCGFGIDTNSLVNPDSQFRQMGRLIFKLDKWESIKLNLCFTVPKVAEFFKFRQTKYEVQDFFLNMVKDTITTREATNTTRNDFMDMLIEMKNKGYIEDVDSVKKYRNEDSGDDSQKFSFPQAAAQAFLFIVGGFETSSTVMQFALYELAKNPDLQERARDEILRVLARHDDKITYDGISEMKYLDMIVAETLRKYPVSPNIGRECTKTYKIPDSDLILEKGVGVLVPVLGLHHDPQYYPDPDRFDPERFTEEEKSKRHHYVYLPFGEGPRNCIGNRFGIMQTKAGLSAILSKYAVHVCEKTPIPIQFEPTNFLLTIKGGMPLKITKV